MNEHAKRLLTARITQREYETILNDASRLGVSISEIVRTRINTGRAPDEFFIPRTERVEHVK